MFKIAAAEALGHAQRFCVRMSLAVEPGPVVITVALDHQRVAVPMPHGVAHPVRIGIFLQTAAVEEDLAIECASVEQNQHVGRLNDLLQAEIDFRPRRQAQNACSVFEQLLFAFLGDFRRPRLWLQRVHCLAAPRAGGGIVAPYAGKIGFAVGQTRSGPGKVRFSVRRARNAGSFIVQPLSLRRKAEGGGNNH